jgi:hypothetical protein
MTQHSIPAPATRRSIRASIGKVLLLTGVAALAGVVGSSRAQTAATPAAASASYAYDDPGRLAGVWIISGYKGSQGFTARQRLLMTADGKMPPLRPAAAQLLERRIQDSDRGEPFANSVTNCLPGGVPEMMFGGPTPIQIIPTRGQVTILFEELNHFRTIYMNEKQPDPKTLDPGFMGHSVGHWEGDTLVVDTIGLTENTTLDGVGMPHSEDLHTVERMRRTGPDTMELLVTIDDPKTFTAPWTAKAIYRFVPQMRISEYICENNRNGSEGSGEATGFHPPPKKK